MMNETKPARASRVQMTIDIILSVLFVCMIFFFGIMTVTDKWSGIVESIRLKKNLDPYLEDAENYSAWDLFEARVKSLDAYLSANLYGATELGYANSTFQYALGKRLVSTGGQQMVTLNSGHLYDLQTYVPMDEAAQEIAALRDSLDADTQFLFVYEHPTVYEADQMPAGYDVLDYSDEIADGITQGLKSLGVDVLDSREILPATGLALSEYLYYTDQHWSTRAALEVAKEIAKELGLDYGLLNIDKFESETYEKLFLGKYGQRVGTGNIDPDDITIFWPTYPTRIRRYTDYMDEITDITGTFKESVIRWKYLQPDEGKTWNIMAYYDYGLVENIDIYTNPDAPDRTILLLKDSYSAPIGGFLSLTARNVIAVDMRRSYSNYDELVAQYDPDAVVVAYSMQMLRDDDYEFQ